ncbi:MAG: hypothetical protein PHW74_06995 [Desulfobacca sp.]|nr:hypothetical protein [Desulfobacca sp.]
MVVVQEELAAARVQAGVRDRAGAARVKVQVLDRVSAAVTRRRIITARPRKPVAGNRLGGIAGLAVGGQSQPVPALAAEATAARPVPDRAQLRVANPGAGAAVIK